jgi:hypothetical protein
MDLYGERLDLEQWLHSCIQGEGSPSASFMTTITSSGSEVRFSSNDDGKDAAKRAVACLLIWKTPSEGLNEAFDYVRDVYKHYTRMQNVKLPPKITTVTGRAGETVHRQKLDILSD